MPLLHSAYITAALIFFLVLCALVAFFVCIAIVSPTRRTRRPGRSRPYRGPDGSGCRRRAQRSTVLDDYGMLRTLALVENLETGRSLCALLATARIRATVTTGRDGLVRVLVFPEAYDRARRMVSWVLYRPRPARASREPAVTRT